MRKWSVLLLAVMSVGLFVLTLEGAPLITQSSDTKNTETEQTEKKKVNEVIDTIMRANGEKINSLLSENPSLIEQTDEKGWTPLHWAAGLGRHTVLPTLQPYINNIDIRSDNEITPLRLAAQIPIDKAKRKKLNSNYRSTVEWLLLHGADVFLQDSKGLTPLRVAVMNERKEIVAVLLNYGADPNRMNDDGFTAIDYARKTGNKAILRLLKRHNELYEQRNRVGVLADFDHVSLSGNDHFTSSDIKSTLRRDSNIISASHPLNPLNKYTKILKKTLREGYQYSGCPDATVDLQLNEAKDHIDLTVEEGPRFTAADVTIRQAGELDPENVRKKITTARLVPVSDEEEADQTIDGQGYRRVEPIWETGEPVPFGSPGKKELAARIEDLIRRFGYAHPEVDVQLERNNADRTARLNVTVKKTGDPYRIRPIEVDGCIRNTKKDLLSYLDLEPGMTYDPELPRRIRRTLRRSGRFLTTEVSLPSPAEQEQDDERTVKLTISVIEAGGIPPLSEELTDRQTRLIKALDRLQNPDRHENDLVLSFDNPSALIDGQPPKIQDLSGKMILDKSGSVLMSAFASSGKQAETTWYDLHLSRQPALYARHLEKKIAGSTFSKAINAQVNIIPKPPESWKNKDVDRDVSDMKFRLRAGGGLDTDPDQNAFTFNLSIPPVFATYVFEHADVSQSPDGQHRIYTVQDKYRLTVKNNTSSVSSLEFLRAPGEDAPPEPVVTISTEKNAHDRSLKTLKKQADDFENVYNAQKPITSIAGFLLEIAGEILPDEEGDRSIKEMVKNARPLIRLGLLSPLDALFQKETNKHEGKRDFSLPASPDVLNTTNAPAAAGMKQLLIKGMGMVGNLFGSDTYPWLISREASRVLNGNTDQTGKVLQWLNERERLGPMGYYTIAYLLRYTGQTRMSKLFVKRGIHRLAWTDVRRDVGLLFEKDTKIGEGTRTFIDHLRGLDEKQVTTLVRLFPPDHQSHVRRLIETAQTGSNDPYALQTYDTPLRQYWRDTWATRMARAFQKLAEQIKKNPSANQPFH